MTINKIDVSIPADVPASAQQRYYENYQAITRGTHRLLMFACDQKIEHLNTDFYGEGIARADNDPEHLFRIAQGGFIGLMATHLGLIARYGLRYPTINYLVKLNGKTNLIPTQQHDPMSKMLWTVDQVVSFQRISGLAIRAVGITIYLGSEFEPEMLEQAAQMIFQAHHHGLIAIIWIYPRGKSVPQERMPTIIAGAGGLAVSLGADFVKLNLPESDTDDEIIEALATIRQAAGTTKVIIAGGALEKYDVLAQRIYRSLHEAGIAGAALGRNLHQRSLDQALQVAHDLAALIYENKPLHT